MQQQRLANSSSPPRQEQVRRAGHSCSCQSVALRLNCCPPPLMTRGSCSCCGLRQPSPTSLSYLLWTSLSALRSVSLCLCVPAQLYSTEAARDGWHGAASSFTLLLIWGVSMAHKKTFEIPLAPLSALQNYSTRSGETGAEIHVSDEIIHCA